MTVGAALATVSSANASIRSAARVTFAMGRDRILLNWLSEVHVIVFAGRSAVAEVTSRM